MTTEPSDTRSRRIQPIQPAQYRLSAAVLVATLGSTALWMLNSNRDSFLRTGIYFVLVPGLLAAFVAVVPFTRHQTGFGVARGTTIGILFSALFLREGFICVLVALPLIIPVVILVAVVSRRSDPDQGRNLRVIIPLALLGLSGEGVLYELPREVEVTESRLVEFSADELDAALSETAELPAIEPLFLRLPFPKPVSTYGVISDGATENRSGSEIGDATFVVFDTGGHLEFTVTDRTDRSVRWAITDRATPMAEWMRFDDCLLTWTDTPEGLEVTVSITFERHLAPAVYFDPLERWGVGEMAEVLLDMVEHNL